jgi:hypothetical protein
MSEIVDIFVPLEALDDSLKVQVARVLGWAETDIGEFRVVRRSLDARKERRLGYRMRVEIARAGESVVPFPSRSQRPSWPVAVKIPRVVIVGSGPAGAWAALRLAEAGVTSIILERGKPVQPRRADLASLHRGQLNPESNYCFGEGGAGTALPSLMCWPTWWPWEHPPTSRSTRGRTLDPTVCPNCWRPCARVCKVWACAINLTARSSVCAKTKDKSARC